MPAAPDSWFALLAEGVEAIKAIAQAWYPDGMRAPSSGHPVADFAQASTLLARDVVTLLDVTLVAGGLQVQAPILVKSGAHVSVFTVVARPFDATAHRRSLTLGGLGEFRNSEGIVPPWRSVISDCALRAKIAQEILPDALVTPWLVLVDSSSRANNRSEWVAAVDVGAEVNAYLE